MSTEDEQEREIRGIIAKLEGFLDPRDNNEREYFDAGIAYANKSRWVKCSERLPKPCELVLVLVHGEIGDPWMQTSFVYKDGSWAHLGSEDYVSHWMPLPAKPEGGI